MINFLYKLIAMASCFSRYYSPVTDYVSKTVSLAFDNNSVVWIIVAFMSFSIECLKYFFNIDFFGVSNEILFLVVVTILFDAYYGVKRSLSIAKSAEFQLAKIKGDTPEKRMLMKVIKMKKFNTDKLQFTFFKCLTLFAYLYFAKKILEVDIEDMSPLAQVIGFSTAVVIKIPLAMFWYKDFKSIGENMEFLFKKKLPIFPIVESIFELKFKQFFKSEEEKANGNNEHTENN